MNKNSESKNFKNVKLTKKFKDLLGFPNKSKDLLGTDVYKTLEFGW